MPMPPARRAALFVLAAVSVPIFPLLVLGLAFEDRVAERVRAAELSPAGRFGVIVGVLALDILLPVPSSAVSTWGGAVLGAWAGAAASALGMTAGAVLGFALARALGMRFASRFAGAADLEQTAALYRRFGPMALAVTRALPILAEACVLLVGAAGLSWRRFLVPVVVGNVVVSVTYAACGQYFQGRDALPVAVIASGTVPLLLALVARRWLPQLLRDEEAGPGEDPYGSGPESGG